MQTLNFGSRLIPVAALNDFRFANLKHDGGEYHVPTLTVRVRGGVPLTIDLQGQILDEKTFKTIFLYPPDEGTGN